MLSKDPDENQSSSHLPQIDEKEQHPAQQQESIQAALALVLGPETNYHTRVRATRRLAKLGAPLLPFLLATLSNYPEITTPTWPWWPPQYEHCGRLLIYLGRNAQLSFEAMLNHPAVSQPPGPVLWASIIEAIGLLPQKNNEALLRAGLETPWMMVRYAAAMGMATRARHTTLEPTTIQALHAHQGETEAFPVRITASYALLNSGEYGGLETLMEFLDPQVPLEARKAATFVFTAELSLQLSTSQRALLSSLLLTSLEDANQELAQQAAHALSKIALPSVLPSLREMLEADDPQKQMCVLIALEEMTRHSSMRRMMYRQGFPARIMLLLKADIPELRLQACYTLAACGGEYVQAVLGTIVCNRDHPAYIEAIEGMRLLHGALHPSTRVNIIRWLLHALEDTQEEVQVTALDSLAYLLLQAHTHGKRQAGQVISAQILNDGILMRLLADPSAWVRQRTVELAGLLCPYLSLPDDVHVQLLRLLRTDSDSGVRASIAYTYRQMGEKQAIPILIQTLLDQDEQVALTALHSLCHLTTADDAIFAYVLKELMLYSDPKSHHPHILALEARAIAKNRRRAEAKERLHSSG